MPGFTARAALYRSTIPYRTLGTLVWTSQTVEPQQSLSNLAQSPTINCPSGLIWCQDGCINPNTDPDNCGRCNNHCADQCCNGKCITSTKDSQNCGQCGIVCPTGYTCCNGSCTNPTSDPNNCGSCGVVCPSGQTCCNGKCCSVCCDDKWCQPGANCEAGRDPSDPKDRSCRVLSETTCDLSQLNSCLQTAQQAYRDCLIDFPPSTCNAIEYYADASCTAQFGCLPKIGGGICCPSGQCTHLCDTSNCGVCGTTCLRATSVAAILAVPSVQI
jgi:hypothetical protein